MRLLESQQLAPSTVVANNVVHVVHSIRRGPHNVRRSKISRTLAPNPVQCRSMMPSACAETKRIQRYAPRGTTTPAVSPTRPSDAWPSWASGQQASAAATAGESSFLRGIKGRQEGLRKRQKQDNSPVSTTPLLSQGHLSYHAVQDRFLRPLWPACHPRERRSCPRPRG